MEENYKNEINRTLYHFQNIEHVVFSTVSPNNRISYYVNTAMP